MLSKLTDNEILIYKQLFEKCSTRGINAKIKGIDTKFLYHVVRLVDECHQILEEGDLDLTRSRKHLQAIRRGEWSMDQVTDYFDQKIIVLEELYSKSKLRYTPDEEKIKQLLIDCIEMHYGSISGAGISNVSDAYKYLVEAQKNIDKTMKIII